MSVKAIFSIANFGYRTGPLPFWVAAIDR